MTITASQCDKCGGTRHVRTKSGWKRCSCVKLQIVENACAEAGIPSLLRSVGAVRMAHDAVVPGIAIPAGHPVVWWVRGSTTSAKRLKACYYPVKLAVELGFPAYATRLSDLIDDRFIEGRPVHAAIKDAVAVYVDLDGVDHKFAGPELLSLYQTRSLSKVVTVFGSSGDIGTQTGRYGAEVARIFAKSKLIYRHVVDSIIESTGGKP